MSFRIMAKNDWMTGKRIEKVIRTIGRRTIRLDAWENRSKYEYLFIREDILRLWGKLGVR